MFRGSPYLRWARDRFGAIDFDLASSGVPAISLSDAGIAVAPEELARLDAGPRLSSAIARFNATPEAEVVPALGTSHAIFLAYAALTSPGDDLLVESPGYDPLVHTAEGLGVTVRTFPRRAEDRFRIDPDAVASRMTPRTRAIVVSNLHNPSGVRLADDDVRALARVAEAWSAHLVVDEVYAPFAALPEDGVFRASARHLAPNVVALGSLTKVFGLPGLRAGWVLAPEDVAERARAAHLDTLGIPPFPHATVAARAFEAIPALAQRAAQIAAGKADLVASFARAHDLLWSAPTEGLFGCVTLPGEGDLLPRIEQLAAERSVLVSAGTFFGAPSSFRVSWANCTRERLAEGLDRLAPLVSGRRSSGLAP